jgi:hypothetical protein
MLAIEYPNVGLYVNGKARYTRRDGDGNVTYARFATPQEEMTWLQITAMRELTEALTSHAPLQSARQEPSTTST